jgi:hypothetical protein
VAIRGALGARPAAIFAHGTFRLTRSLTLSYGLNFLFETPMTDTGGRQVFIINTATGQPLFPKEYLAQKAAAAMSGQTYNPTIGFVPASSLHRSIYPNQVKPAPRLAVSWSPSFHDGLLGKLVGENETVVRGGYALVYERINAVEPVEYPLLGDQLAGTLNTIEAPLNAAGQPYRVGVDGPVPIPVPPASIPVPYIPASRNIALGTSFGIASGNGFDPNYSVGHVHSVDFSIQRQLTQHMVIELGGIGRYGRNLPMGVNLNAVPVFIKDMSGKSNQTFAQAFDSLATQLRSGTGATAVTPQSWFENNLGPGGTVNLATADASDIISGALGSLFVNQIDPTLLSLGKPSVLNQQFQDLFYGTNGAWSNYNAFFASLHTQFAHGLSFATNYTWSHCSDLGGSVQDNLSGDLTDPYNPGFDYGDCITDRRNSFTAYGTYQLPFAKEHNFLGGWHVSLIFSAYTGLPLDVTQSGSVFGDSYGTESVPLISGAHLASQGVHRGVTGSGGVGTAGDPADGGTGINLFADPEAAFNDFRPFLLSQDTRTSRGLVRDPGWWNVDASIGKTFKVHERVKITLTVDSFNLFNHTIFSDPQVSLLSPANFGVITQQAGNPAQGDFAGARRVQAGLRVEF